MTMMTNREKILKTNIYDLMMAIVKRGCPLAIIAGKCGPEIKEWQDCTEDCAKCVQKWLNEEVEK